MNKKSILQNQQGSFLVTALIIIILLVAIGLSLSGLVASQYSNTSREMFADNAMQVAEAGIEESVNQLNTDDSFTGYTTPQVFFDNSTQGKGVFTTTITDNPDGKSKSIVATGEVYRNDSATTPYVTRTVKVTVVGTASSGYSVFTGPGGLILSGSANIVNSDVYVNGYINISGRANIGTVNQPLNVDVANYQCPPGGGSTYPALCTDGTQPITMSGSSHIYGNVCATGQTSSTGSGTSSISGGNGGSGLESGCVAPNTSPPTYNRAAQIAAVTTTASASDINYDCSQYQSPNGFSRTWPANLELTGNVSASSSCNLTITGNVYITGNLTIGGAAQIRVDDSVGTTRPIIMVDGTITVGGSASMIANSSGTGIEFISFKNSTGNPSATPTGQDLYNSQSQQTVSVAGAGNLPGMIFDAYWGEVTIAGSGTIGSAIGQTVNLSGAGTVTFGTDIASGTQTWTIRSYQRIYN